MSKCLHGDCLEWLKSTCRAHINFDNLDLELSTEKDDFIHIAARPSSSFQNDIIRLEMSDNDVMEEARKLKHTWVRRPRDFRECEMRIKGFKSLPRDMRREGVHWMQWVSSDLISNAPRTFMLPKVQQGDQMASQPGLLFTLPAEIRNMISEYVMHDVRTQDPRHDECLSMMLASRYAAEPSLTRTCKQLRSESLPLFYSSNTFALLIDSTTSLQAARSWLAKIGDYNLGQIQNMVLIGYLGPSTTSPMSSRNIPVVRLSINLQSIRINALTVEGHRRALPAHQRLMETMAKNMGAQAEGYTIRPKMLNPLLNSLARLCHDKERPGLPIRTS